MAHVIVVTGLPGVGKTTVLNELQKIAKQSKLDLAVVNYGTVMMEMMKSMGKEIGRDDIRKQSIEAQKEAQERAANEIMRQAKKHVTVIDTHLFVRTKFGQWAGLPKKVLEKLNPDLLVFLEADPDQIFARRHKDSDRAREKLLRDEISSDLELSRSMAAACSMISGSPIKIIRNDSGKQREAAQELFDFIRHITEGDNWTSSAA